MANRYIRDSILMSDSIDQLTPFQESFFYRLLVTVDDFGRFDGRITVMRNRMYPLKEFGTKAESEAFKTEIAEAVDKLAELGMITRYEVMGKPYIHFTNWEKYQRNRTAVSKYPDENGEYTNPNGNFSKKTNRRHGEEDVQRDETQLRCDEANTRHDLEPEANRAAEYGVTESNAQREKKQESNHAADCGVMQSEETDHATDNDYDIDYDNDTLAAQGPLSGEETGGRDGKAANTCRGTPEANAFDKAWTNSTGKRPGSDAYAMFFKLRKQYPFSKVMQAINAAFMQGQPGNWTYIIGILQDGRDAWRKKKPSGMTVEKRGGKTYIDGLEVVL